MKTFNKKDFIDSLSGDLTMLSYVKETKIDKTGEDKKDFLNNLYTAIIFYNIAISNMESNSYITENYKSIYDMYTNLKLTLLKELNIPIKWLEEKN